MTSVSTTVDSGTGDFVISWIEPDTNGDPITAYTVEIQSKTDSTWVVGACSDSPCSVDMLSLGEAPYGYARDDLIIVRAKATNTLGIGPYSNENSVGATLRTLSDAPGAVTRGSETSENEIVLEWTAGDASILSYNLVVWDSISDQLSTSLVGLETPFTSLTFTYSDGVIEGTDYTFKLRT